jgi:hypothetical protein
MSVLECDRTGCPNIMCDRLNDVYGYICDSCYEELVASNRTDIASFMGESPPNEVPVPIEFYEKTFPIR